MYTLVQHSGFAVTDHDEFEQAVETRQVRTTQERQRVAAAGGILLASYTEAEEAAERENYPADYDGLIPQARGTFAELLVGGLRVYQPPKEE